MPRTQNAALEGRPAGLALPTASPAILQFDSLTAAATRPSKFDTSRSARTESVGTQIANAHMPLPRCGPRSDSCHRRHFAAGVNRHLQKRFRPQGPKKLPGLNGSTCEQNGGGGGQKNRAGTKRVGAAEAGVKGASSHRLTHRVECGLGKQVGRGKWVLCLGVLQCKLGAPK